MNRLILFLLVITLFSCNYIKKRVVKDDLINAYTLEIELLKTDIETERLKNKMIINEYKMLLTERAIYKTAIVIKEKHKQNTEEYQSKIDQLDSDIKKIRNQFSDTAVYNDSIHKQIEYYNNKLNLIKENDFDYDTEMSHVEIFNKRTKDREISDILIKERLDSMKNDNERRKKEIKELEEEIHLLINR